MGKHMNWKIAISVVAGVFLMYSLLGFFAVPFAGKKLIEKGLRDLPGCAGGVGKIRFNPYTLAGTLDTLSVNDEENRPLFRLQKCDFNVSAISLFKLAPVVTALDLYQPELFLILEKDNRFNVQSIGGVTKASAAPEDQGPSYFPFRLSNAGIHNGTVYFTDKMRGSEQVVDRINMALPLLTSLEDERDTPAKPALNFRLNGAPIDIDLTSLPFTPDLETRMDLTAQGIDLGPLLDYVIVPKALKVNAPGRMDLLVSAAYRQDPGQVKHAHMLGIDLDATLKNMDLGIWNTDHNAATPFLSSPEMVLKAQTKDLLSGRMVIKHLAINNTRLALTRKEDGSLNVADLMPEAQDKASPADAPTAQGQQDLTKASHPFQFHITVDKGGFNNGEILFTDHCLSPTFTTEVSGFDLNFSKMEIGPQGVMSGRYQVNFTTAAKETLALNGTLSTTPALKLDGRLDISGVMPDKYRPYYAPYGGRGLSVEALTAGTGFSVAMAEETPVFSISDGSVRINGIRIQGGDDNEPVVQMTSIDCKGISMNSTTRNIGVEMVTADAGRLDLIRDKQGHINLVQRVYEMVAAPPTDRAHFGLAAEGEVSGAKSPETPWELSLGRLDLLNYDLAFSDLGPETPVRMRVGNIGICVEDLSTIPGKKGRIQTSMVLEEKGKINISGSVDLSSMATALDLDIKNMGLNPFNPYVTQYLNILIEQGYMDTHGRLTVFVPDRGEPNIRYKGNILFGKFSSKTQNDNNDFFKCNALFLSDMDMDLTPMSINIGKIALTDFYQIIDISEHGMLNLSRIVKHSKDQNPKDQTPVLPKTSTPSAEKERHGPSINIDAVTMQGGTIHFTDHYTPPGYSVDMTKLGGSLTGLSSLPEREPAKLLLKGTYADHAPLEVAGLIDPLKNETFADLTVSFKNIELPQFNTYTEKFLGYRIAKGKLILNLEYDIKDKELNSMNRIFLDQLTLGERVYSPDAVSLPLDFAISLLKNSKDEIKLNVPIHGQLDDPKFSYGSVVATALKNVILGIVSAPFKFLGGMFGLAKGQDLGHVAFEPGSDVLGDSDLEKIDQLSKILMEKEKLSLEIDGTFNPEKDREGIRRSKYNTQLSKVQARSGIAEGKDLNALTPQERAALVAAAYDDAEFPKPREESGAEKALSSSEQEKLLLTSITVTEKELKDLALRRSGAVHNRMVNSGGIETRRIFVKEPMAVADDKIGETPVKTIFELK